MADNLTKAQRSYCMSRVKAKDTSIELEVRSTLHQRGLRFRKHVSGLPGKPDVVFPSSRLVIFLDGDFWHGYRFPQWEHKLTRFWKKKISDTRQRDRRNHATLRASGWHVIRIWQHELKKDFPGCIDRIVQAVRNLS